MKQLLQDQEERVDINVIDVATECYMAFVPLFKYYSHLFMGHRPSFSAAWCLHLRKVTLLNKKICRDREIGV